MLVALKMQKLSLMTLPLQIQERKYYLALFLMINSSSNIPLKIHIRALNYAHCRVLLLLSVLQKKLFNVFFQSQFSYCPLVWMCQSRTLNNKIKRLHERCLTLNISWTFKKKIVPFLFILETFNFFSWKCIN